MFKKEKNDVNKTVNSYLNNNKENEKDPLLFLVGIVLLAAGLFMLSRRVMVHSSWYMWRIGSFDISSGTVVIPLIIGIIWYFFDSKSVVPKVIIILGIIFIVLSIIMSVRINFVTTSMFDYVLILGMAAAGAGLLLKSMYKNKK